MAGQMQGKDRFRPTVLVTAAWIDPVATTARREIGEHRAAIVGAEEPAPGGLGMRDPERIVRDARGGAGTLDAGLRLERLLVEGQHFAVAAKAFRTDRAELAVDVGLELG